MEILWLRYMAYGAFRTSVYESRVTYRGNFNMAQIDRVKKRNRKQRAKRGGNR